MWVWLNDNVGMTPGWYDINTWESISRTIDEGEGFLMTVDSDVTMTAAGQVTGETIVPLKAGFSVVGNSSPVDVDLQSITLGAEAAGDGTECIQVLDYEGQLSEMWVWLNDNVGMTPGWYDINTWEPIEKTVAAGTAYLITVDAATTFTIPSAL